MSETAMEQYASTALEQDHAEALQIDALVDAYKADGMVPADALSQAIAHNNQSLMQLYAHIPGAEEIGYDPLKNAFRWWNYATAYLRELEADLQPGEVLPIGRANYGETKNAMGDRLIGGNVLAIRMCDILERERRSRGQRENKEHTYEYFDLFGLQSRYAALALATAAELMVEDSGRDEGLYGGEITNNGRIVDYKLQRLGITGQTLYIIHKHLVAKAEEYDDTKDEVQGTYSFTRPHKALTGLAVYPERPEELTATDILDMTDDFCSELGVNAVLNEVEAVLESRIS